MQCISALPSKFVIQMSVLTLRRDLSHLRVREKGSGERGSNQSGCLVMVDIKMTGQLVSPPSVSMKRQKSQPQLVPVTLSRTHCVTSIHR